MNHDQVAKVIQQEFGVPCFFRESTHDYIFNAPRDVYGAELRRFREQVGKRIDELLPLQGEQDGCTFRVGDRVIRKGEGDAEQFGFVHGFCEDNPEKVLVAWASQGLITEKTEEIVAGLMAYGDWQQNPLVGLKQYWGLSSGNQQRLKKAVKGTAS